MKSILVLGDSISVHYGMYLKEMLCGFFAFHQKDGREEALKDLDVAVGGNGGDSLRLLGIIREKYDNNLLNYDYVLFNCGLHDIKRDPLTAKIQVTVGEYKANLYSIFDFLKNAGALPIWIRTTMVVDERHNSRVKEFKRYNRDVAVYNEAADSIVKECGIGSIDLYKFTKNFGDEAYCDHVHFKEEMRKLQAAFIAGGITSLAGRAG